MGCRLTWLAGRRGPPPSAIFAMMIGMSSDCTMRAHFGPSACRLGALMLPVSVFFRSGCTGNNICQQVHGLA